MKTRTLTSLVVTCAVCGYGNTTGATKTSPVVYSGFTGTNMLMRLVPVEQPDAGDHTNRVGPHAERGDAIVATNQYYQLLLQSGKEVTDDEDTPSRTVADMFDLQAMAADAIVTTSGGIGVKKPVQIFVIEDFDPDEEDNETWERLDQSLIFNMQPDVAWHEWLKPNMVIAKWADIWMTETNATPVVLLMMRF